MPLKPGDKAPTIALTDQHGKARKLSEFKGRKVLVYFTLLDQNGEPFTLSKSLRTRKLWHFLYFYPKTSPRLYG